MKRLFVNCAPLPPSSATVHYLRTEGRLQDAAELASPWRETLGAGMTDDFPYTVGGRRHFFCAVDPNVPAPSG